MEWDDMLILQSQIDSELDFIDQFEPISLFAHHHNAL